MTSQHDRQRKADARVFDQLLKIDAKVATLLDKEFDDIDKRDKESCARSDSNSAASRNATEASAP